MVRIKDLMSSSVTTIESSKSVYDAARMMSNGKMSGLAVVDEGENPVGVVTERDMTRRIVAEKLDPTKVKVDEIMSKPPITISSHLPIEDAVKLMAKSKIKRLLVLEDDRLVGIITATDLIRYAASFGFTGTR